MNFLHRQVLTTAGQIDTGIYYSCARAGGGGVGGSQVGECSYLASHLHCSAKKQEVSCCL